MCWCRPEIRTPFCGRPECHPPVVAQPWLEIERLARHIVDAMDPKPIGASAYRLFDALMAFARTIKLAPIEGDTRSETTDQPLRPCRFCCNSTTVSILRLHNGPVKYSVTCMLGSGGCGGSTGLYQTEAEARDIWNGCWHDAQWRDAETNPPPHDVIIYLRAGGKGRSVGLAYPTVSGGWCDSEYDFRGVSFTHWMPLPQPPL